MKVLMKLSDHLATSRGNLIMMQPLPTISHAYKMLAQEERQRELNVPSIQHHESHTFAENRRRYNDYQNRGNYRGKQANNSHMVEMVFSTTTLLDLEETKLFTKDQAIIVINVK